MLTLGICFTWGSGSLAPVTTLLFRAIKRTQCPIRGSTSTSNLVLRAITIPPLLPLLRHRPRKARLRNAGRQKRGLLAGQNITVEAMGRSLDSSRNFAYYVDLPTTRSGLLWRFGILTLFSARRRSVARRERKQTWV